ncbi:class I SAM-dependent methyltransferase [Sphingosinicella microcystinivorans]|uniref:2-polyprenyl-6-hydroxyphenyl methylase/3-demethylubiquinone-9 3-methyltransferase n=1 Tax=Sphingosinicella microcystinivorans TaxID=335406 RepID=A0AAD1D5K8_SPHMI|nr:class I SAM-dependent methyltransferase [Sphingosinicella microcystinivorans]RKS90881.1 2-polyprenyl-6-hydroxyphenyl methylase/3-demethylubiquinone-9 3-methyltransferase [Sphingosinicella microcystinivorans]BBE33797.1 SAM-dependent methyltransferase [Sphingosinicella microcystinivorans]
MDAVSEIDSGERFGFGKNWSNFLKVLDEARIEQAEKSLRTMLEVETLKGLSLLDIGSGSGLFSLAARRLGATVHSFDFDPNSVACAIELKRRYFPNCEEWKIEQGSALDTDYLDALPEFDIVYSWGVLHHTGSMWDALQNASLKVKDNGGKLFISIYNDQGLFSRYWLIVKKIYNRLPNFLRNIFAFFVMFPREVASFMAYVLRGNPSGYFRSWTQYKKQRGMSRWHDIIDWVGGLPFEVAKPEQIFDFYYKKGFSLERLSTCAGGLGCNEYVFFKNSHDK